MLIQIRKFLNDMQKKENGDILLQYDTAKEYARGRLAKHVLLTENISLYEHLGWGMAGRDSVRITMGNKFREGSSPNHLLSKFSQNPQA